MRSRPSAEGRPEPAEQLRRLEAEVAGLRRAMRTRGLIEQAKGRLAEQLGVGIDEAFQQITRRSQQSNTAVVDVAADIVGVSVGDADDRDLHRPEVRLRAAIESATVPDDLVEALAEAVDATAVALFAAQPGGALLLLSAYGWPESLRSDWRWIPPALVTPAAEAIRRGVPIWATGDMVHIGPTAVRVAVPVLVDDSVMAAVEVGLPPGSDVDPLARRRLERAAAAVGAWMASATDGPAIVHSGFDDQAADAVLGALLTPGAVLSPVWTDDKIEDFRIDRANPRAVAAWRTTVSAGGRRLLDVDPDARDDGRFDAFVGVYRGERPPAEPTAWGAVRLGGRLLVSWRRDEVEASGRIAAMEELGSFGWGEWARSGEPLTVSSGLAEVVGQPRRRLSLEHLVARFEPEDRATVQSTLDDLLADGQPHSLEVRLRRFDQQVRRIRLALAARRDHQGAPRAVVALFQDVTEIRLGAEAAAKTAERLAAQRVRAAFEHAQTEQLRQAFFPPPRTEQRCGPLRAVARHAAPRTVGTFRGDFYEVDQHEDGLVLAVGDVFGSGIAAAHTMVRLRHSARAFLQFGTTPADVLQFLNRELSRDKEPPLASMLLATVDPAARVTWAQAGHYSPVLVRQGRARTPRRPRGDLLGLFADSEYRSGATQLVAGDLFVLYTDGVFQRWSDQGKPIRHVLSEIEAAWHDLPPGGAAEALIERLSPSAVDEACVVCLEWTV